MAYDGKFLYDDFEKHHLAVLNAVARYKVIIWHRKARKTTLCLKHLIKEAFRVKGVYWYVAPHYNQAKRIVWEDPDMLNRWLPSCCKTNDSELKIAFPNGSIIRLIGADNPESLRGSGLAGVIIDEFDDIDINVWNTVLRPMLALTQGWAWFIGTPKGYGNLYEFRERALQNRETDWWCADLLDAETSGLIPQNEIEALQRAVETGELPKMVYDQEYRCQFVSGGSGLFRRIRENLWEGDLRPIRDEHRFKLGIDIAKLSDFTVITPIRLHDLFIGFPDRFNKIDYPMLEARIESNWRKYNRGTITLDANAMGEAVADHLEKDRDISNIERFKTTEATREQLLKNLSILIETDRLKIPNDAQLIKELEAMRYDRDEKTKKIKIVSSIDHDDMVMSLAYACWDIKQIPLEIKNTWLQEEFRRAKIYRGEQEHQTPLDIV